MTNEEFLQKLGSWMAYEQYVEPEMVDEDEINPSEYAKALGAQIADCWDAIRQHLAGREPDIFKN